MKAYNLEEDSVQWNFWHSRAKIQGMTGSFANGKSTALIVGKALKLIREYPGCTGLMARATYPKLNDTLRKDFLMWCPPHWITKRPTQDDNSCYFTNKSAVHFRYIAQRGKMSEDGTTTSNLLSATYDWIIVDQIEDPEITEKDFLDLLGRLRGSTPYKPKLRKGETEDSTMPITGPRWFCFGANPTHNWVNRKLIRPYHQWKERGIYSPDLIVGEVDYGQYKLEDFPLMELFEGDVYSNAKNLSTDYIKTLEAAYKGQMYERYVLGKWTAFEGLVYSTFSRERNVLTRGQMLRHLKDCVARKIKVQVLEGYDFGNVSPTCYLIAFVDDLGRVFILDGFYIPEFSYEQHPKTISDIRSKYMGLLTPTEPIWADPDIFRKKVVSGQKAPESLHRILKHLGLNTKAGDNNIQSGIAKVSTYWNGRPDVSHVITGEAPGPMMYVCEDLTWYLDEIDDYFWKKSPLGEYIDEPQDRKDHAMDTTKYLLTKRPLASEIVLSKYDLPPKWKFWHEVNDAA